MVSVHPELNHGDPFSFCNPIRPMANPPAMWSTEETDGNYGSDFSVSPRWNHNSTGLYTTPVDGTEDYYATQGKNLFSSNPYNLNHMEDTTSKHQSLINAVDIRNSVYELSLRDLVELPRIAKSVRENQNSRRNDFMFESRSSSFEKRNQKPKYSRSKSMGNGSSFLLKMFFPASLTRRKKGFSKTSESYIVLRPKHIAVDGDHGIIEELNDEKNMKNELTIDEGKLHHIDEKIRSRCYCFFHMKKSKCRHV